MPLALADGAVAGAGNDAPSNAGIEDSSKSSSSSAGINWAVLGVGVDSIIAARGRLTVTVCYVVRSQLPFWDMSPPKHSFVGSDIDKCGRWAS